MRVISRTVLFQCAPIVIVVLGAVCPCALAKGLQSGTAYGVGKHLNGVALGDFNSDGKLDILLIDNPGGTITSTIHVLLGNGDGTFQPTVDSTATSDLIAEAVGDFNGDGKLDVAVVDSVLHKVEVFLGNGDGTFTLKTTLTAGDYPGPIASADLNGDGRLDLVVGDAVDMTLTTFLGAGDGTFTLKSVISAAGAGTVNLNGVTVGDFDGDHKPDVAVSFAEGVNVLRGNGDGTLSAPMPLQLPIGSTNPSGVVAADFDGDGGLDIIVLTNKVLFYSGNGNLSFQPAKSFDVQARPSSVAVADVNGDHHPDLVVSNWFSDSVTVLLGDGHGGVSTSWSYSAVQDPLWIASGDFNGDGKPDFVAVGGAMPGAANNVGIALGNGDGTLHDAFAYQYQLNGTLGGSVGLVAGDFNGDGQSDIVAADAGNRVTSLLNAGHFVFNVVQPANTVSSISTEGLVAADMNGDGNLDVLASDTNTISTLLGNGDGTFKTPLVQSLNQNGTHKLAVGDFNADGKLDLVYTIADSTGHTFGVLLGNGDGTFQPSPIVTIGTGLITAIAVGDFNGDGKLDVAIANGGTGSTNSTVSIFLGNGDGTFQLLGTQPTVGIYPLWLAVADLNQDGKLDLVVGNSGNSGPGSVSVLIGNGDGTFQPTTYPPLAASLSALVVADFSGDGIPDIAVSEIGGAVDVYSNNGDGTFGLPAKSFAGATPFYLAASDLNSAGAADLIATVDTSLMVLPNTGGSHVTLSSSLTPTAFDQQVTFTVTVTPSVPGSPVSSGLAHLTDAGVALGDVSLSSSGSGTFSINSLAVGTHLISGSYAGDANYFARALPVISQVVNKAATSTALSTSAAVAVVGDALTFSVAVTPATGGIPTGNISLAEGTTVLASTPLDASGNASFILSNLSAGIHSLAANYAGDNDYLASTALAVNVQVFATPDFLISSSPQSASVRAGLSANVTIQVSPTAHFTGPMTFSCSGLPSESACSFKPSSLPLNAANTSAVVTISTTAPSLAPPSGAWRFPWGLPYVQVILTLFLITRSLLSRSRRSPALGRAFVGIVIFAITLLSGCGGGGPTSPPIPHDPGTPTGSSSVVITATAATASGNASHQLTVTLTVTP